METKLWSDLETDKERIEFLQTGRGVETGIIAPVMIDEVIKLLQLRQANPLKPLVVPVACGSWQKTKPDKPCYFIHRYDKNDTYPSLFEAKMDYEILIVMNIQDDEFVETMEGFADGEFFIIEK